ncbi:polysaccharide lyase family 7 protein [Streptomyces niveus]|uniref:polysaccharide lyase family 7 protein n=1 Tax=Streptomyces niveus TaxID=193462 RepID=UPI003689E321
MYTITSPRMPLRATNRRRAACAVASLGLGAALLSAGPTAVAAGPAACESPAKVLGLTSNWKIQLPVDDPNASGTQPLEIKQPALASYDNAPWFTPTSACDGVKFRAAVNGATTTNTSYPRSELREMTNNGASNASWSSTSGTHTLIVDQAINRLPSTKSHVVAGQIHDGNDRSVFRLEGTSLYVTKDNDTHHKLVTDNYKLGTEFEAKFVVGGGNIKAYYNGVLQTTIPVKFTTGYFKAGVYTQANCGNSSPCDTSNYGETTLYNVSVKHS